MPEFKRIAILLLMMLGAKSSAQIHADVLFQDLEKTYTGSNLFPTVTTNPTALQVQLSFVPRVSEVVYKTTPAMLDFSHASAPMAGLTNKALGDSVTLGGTNRMLESIDVVLVNWAKASDWPTLAASNPAGYYHPVTIFLYSRTPNISALLAQKTQQVLVPWRPETLGDGSAYPYGGYSFNIRFNFPTGVTLTDSLAVMVAYNTQSTGFTPIGTAGPYNSLNVALTGDAPSIGTDISTSTMLRYENSFINTQNFGPLAPIFTIRAFPASPASGTAVNPGIYIATGTIISPGYEGSATTDFTVVPAPATVTLGALQQSADGTPKTVSVTTSPPGLSYSVMYSGQFSALASPPSSPGSYPVRAIITSPNYSGQATGTLVLGRTLASWLHPWITSTELDPLSAGQLDDPDHDGVPNLLEYAFDFNPVSSANNGKGLGALQVETTPTTFAVTYRKQTSVDLSFQVQTTTHLTDSNSWVPAVGTQLPLGTDGTIQTIKLTIDRQPGEGVRFFRLLVTKS